MTLPLYRSHRIHSGRRIYRALLAAVAMSSGGAIAHAASWSAAVSGDWADLTKWTGNTVPPSNAPTTIAASGAAYTVTTLDPRTVETLVLNSADATLQTGGNLTIGTSFSLLAGQLDGIVKFRQQMNAQTLTFGDLNASGTFHLTNLNYTLINGTTGPASANVSAGVSLVVLDNAAVHVQSGAANYGTITLQGDQSKLRVVNTAAGTEYINHGTITAQGLAPYGGVRTIEFANYPIATFVNSASGIINIDASTTLNIYFRNEGTINVGSGATFTGGGTLSSGTLNINGTFSTETLWYEGGQVNGTVTFAGFGTSFYRKLLISNSSTVGSGTYRFTAPGTVDGNIRQGMTVEAIPGFTSYPTLTLLAGQRNDGVVKFETPTENGSTPGIFIDGNGTYTSAGTLNYTYTGTTPFTGQYMTGSEGAILHNAGVFNLTARLYIDVGLVNSGTMNVAASNYLTAKNATLAGGTLNLTGGFFTPNLTYTGGTVNGVLTLQAGFGGSTTMTMGSQTVAAGTFMFISDGQFNGNVLEGMTLNLRNGGSGASGNTLRVNGGQANYGTISLSSQGPSASTSTFRIIGPGAWTNYGTLSMEDGSTFGFPNPTTRNVFAENGGWLENAGTFNVRHNTNAILNFVNTGTINIAAGKTLAAGGLTVSGGNVNASGTLQATTLTFTGGAINGLATVNNTLRFGGQTSATGSFLMSSGTVRGVSTFETDIPAGVTITARTGTSENTLNVYGGGSNNGRLVFDSLTTNSSSSSILKLNGEGDFTNNGIIDFNGGGADPITRNVFGPAALVNGPGGVINVNANANLDLRFVNAGTINIAVGKMLAAYTATIAGGTLNLSAGRWLQANPLTYTGGTINGEIEYWGNFATQQLTVGNQSTGSGTFRFTHAAQVTGNILPGMTVISEAGTNLNPALTVTSGASNGGVLTLRAMPSVGANTVTLAISGGGVYTNTGTVNFNGGHAGYAQTRTVTGAGATFLNAAGGVVNFNGSPTTTLSTTFQTSVENYGTFKNTAATVSFQQTFTNHGTYVSDPAVNNFVDLVVGSTGSLHGGAGDVFNIAGDFTNGSTAAWQTSAATLTFTGNADHKVTINGPGKAEWGTISIGDGASMTFLDGDGGSAGAMYAIVLDLPTLAGGAPDLAGMTFDNIKLYFDGSQLANAYLVNYLDSLSSQDRAASPLQMGLVPEPASLSLIALAGTGLLARRRRRL